MPKTTFFNLPDSKREKIENAAMDEFSQYGYSKASVNRIIRSAGIATGSFYQYFEDIDDLFIYILQRCGEKKIEYIEKELANLPDESFADYLKAIYTAGIKFAVENKRMFNIANCVLEAKNILEYQKLFEKIEIEKIIVSMDNMLEQAKEKKEIRQDVDVYLVMSIMKNISISVMEHIQRKKQNDSVAVVFQEQDYLDLSQLAVELLLYGIIQRKEENDND